MSHKSRRAESSRPHQGTLSYLTPLHLACQANSVEVPPSSLYWGKNPVKWMWNELKWEALGRAIKNQGICVTSLVRVWQRFQDSKTIPGGLCLFLRWLTLAVRRWQLFCRMPSRSDGFGLDWQFDVNLALCPTLFRSILAQVVDVDAEDTKRRSAEVDLQFCCSQCPFYLDFADMPRCSLSLSKFVSGFEHQPADS